MRNIFILFAFCFMLMASQANAQGIAKDLDWVAKWGSLDLTSANDPIIPFERHSVKRDTKAAVIGCKPAPQDPAYSKLKMSEIDINGDSLNDIIVDPVGYFNNLEQLATCPVHICREKDGCNIHVYINAGDTQIIEGTATKENPCPATAEANTTCRKECSAVEKQCPALFNHVREVAWSGWAFGYSFISVADYSAMREANKAAMPDKSYIYRAPINSNPVYKVVRARNFCNNEEMDLDHDGVIPPSAGCIKYMQYTHDKVMCRAADGCFVDLYYPTVIVNPTDKSARYIDSVLSPGPVDFFKASKSVAGRGATSIDGVDIKGQGFKLAHGHAIASQVPDFDTSAAAPVCKDVEYEEDGVCEPYGRAPVGDASSAEPVCPKVVKTKKVCTKPEQNLEFVCYEFYNNSASKDVFIPAETDEEYQSFMYAAENGKIEDLIMKKCEKQFTKWVGPRSCVGIDVACDETKKIPAERTCIRSTSSLASCSECATATDSDPIPGFEHACTAIQECHGPVCPAAANFCVAADTKVLMADGTEKEIMAVSVGDKVKAFDSKDPLKSLKDAKVKAVMITGEKTVITLNDLKITSVHKVVLEGGKVVEAKDVKIGDKIIKADGHVVVVKEITEKTTPVTVYNMDVEGADGYIAGGLRVLDYPVPDSK